MASDREESASANTFVLTCTDCAFERTVDGSANDALDVAENHQANHGEGVTDHFVNFERRDDG